MPVFVTKSEPSEVLTQWPIFQHGLVNHMAKLTKLADGEIFLYSHSWLVAQRNRCWIKGLGKNPQKEWAGSLFAVPFVRGLPSVTHWTPRKWHVCQS